MRTKLYLLLNIVLAMRFLISKEIVHLDLKPTNVIVTKQLIPKIIDFGEAYHRDLCPKCTQAPTQTTLPASPSPTSPHRSASNTSTGRKRMRRGWRSVRSRTFLPSE
jgi:serine/threonine protein kinase